MITWIDFLIMAVILLYAWSGYRQGFLRLLVDILGIVISFIVGLKFYNLFGEIFIGWGLNPNLAKPIGFFALWTIVQIIFWILTIILFHYIPTLFHQNRYNKIFGIIPGFFKGVMIVAIFLIILMILPFSSIVKDKLSQSVVSGYLIRATAKIENQMENVLGELNNTLTFVGPVQETDGTSKLNFQTDKFAIDEEAENEMLVLINEERLKNGLAPLLINPLIRNVARSHSMDMLQKGYFAHENLAGQTPAERMVLAHVIFKVAGENLALAPSVDLAHIGLMNSPKHRENILDPDYGRIGIGIMDAGVYGLMITEDFAD